MGIDEQQTKIHLDKILLADHASQRREVAAPKKKEKRERPKRKAEAEIAIGVHQSNRDDLDRLGPFIRAQQAFFDAKLSHDKAAAFAAEQAMWSTLAKAAGLKDLVFEAPAIMYLNQETDRLRGGTASKHYQAAPLLDGQDRQPRNTGQEWTAKTGILLLAYADKRAKKLTFSEAIIEVLEELENDLGRLDNYLTFGDATPIEDDDARKVRRGRLAKRLEEDDAPALRKAQTSAGHFFRAEWQQITSAAVASLGGAARKRALINVKNLLLSSKAAIEDQPVKQRGGKELLSTSE